MRIAEDDPRPHADQLVNEEEAVLEHLLEDEHRPLCLSRDGQRDRGEVGRERGPRAILDLGDLVAEIVLDPELLVRRDSHASVAELDVDAETPEHRKNRDEVVDDDVVDGHVAARDRGQPDEARDLDVLRCDAPLAAAEPLDAADAEHV
jgi:hypothetical protein